MKSKSYLVLSFILVSFAILMSLPIQAESDQDPDWDKSSLSFEGETGYYCSDEYIFAEIKNTGESIDGSVWKYELHKEVNNEFLPLSQLGFSNYSDELTSLGKGEVKELGFTVTELKEADYKFRFFRPDGHPGENNGGWSDEITIDRSNCDDTDPEPEPEPEPELDFTGDLDYYCDPDQITAEVKNTGEVEIDSWGYILIYYEGNDYWAPRDVGGSINNLYPGDTRELTLDTSDLEEGQYRILAYEIGEETDIYSGVSSGVIIVDRSPCEEEPDPEEPEGFLTFEGEGNYYCEADEFEITVKNTGEGKVEEWNYWLFKVGESEEENAPIGEPESLEDLEKDESYTITYDTSDLDEGKYQFIVYKYEEGDESNEIVLDRSDCSEEPEEPEEPEDPEEPKGDLTYEGDGSYYCESDEIQITVKNTGEGTAEEWSYGLLKIEDGERIEALPGPYSIESLESGETYTITMDVSDQEDGVYQFTLFNYETGEFSSDVVLDRSECEEEPEEPEEPKEEEPKEDEEKPEEPEEEQEEPKEEVESDQDEEEEEEDVLPQTGFNLPLWNYLLGGLVAASGLGVLVFRRPKFLTSDL